MYQHNYFSQKLKIALSMTLVDFRNNLQINQKEFSRLSGISTEFISKIENRKAFISMNTLIILAQALNTTPSKFIESIDQNLKKIAPDIFDDILNFRFFTDPTNDSANL